MKILSPENGATVSLLTEKQKQFIAAEDYRKTVPGDLIFQWNNLSPQPGTDESRPQPVEVRWTPELPATVSLSNGTTLRGEPGLLLWNLCPNTAYTLTVTTDDGQSDTVQFCTADEQPRYLWVDGLTNVRDIGGWKTRDGRRIRYNMLFRGSEMDTHCDITADGVRTMTETLRIRTDLDLRGEASDHTGGVLDPHGVRWALIPVEPYDDIFKPEMQAQYRAIFELLTDPASYPVYEHCWGGADRAGTVAFLVEAALGVPEDDLILDYELTTLSIWGTRTRNTPMVAKMLAQLREMGEGDIHLGVRRYIGDEVVEKLRAILLD